MNLLQSGVDILTLQKVSIPDLGSVLDQDQDLQNQDLCWILFIDFKAVLQGLHILAVWLR